MSRDDLMEPEKINTQWLVSLPASMHCCAGTLEPDAANGVSFFSDPPGYALGSGGGTAHVLYEAYLAVTEGNASFADWLTRNKRVVLHGGGKSRRLPAYASIGKPFIPVPVFRWSTGQRLNQALIDLQRPFVDGVLQQAGGSACLAIASGDVLIHHDAGIEALPDADVVMIGLWARPEEAQHFGVMFCEQDNPESLSFFLQKPSPDLIREHSRDHHFLIDAGVWILSARAVRCLMQQCGWEHDQQSFPGDIPSFYDLYSSWGPCFGTNPSMPSDVVRDLSVAVAPLDDARFFHFGRSKDIIESVYELQNLVLDSTRLGTNSRAAHPRQITQNARIDIPLGKDRHQQLWVENACIPRGWSLGGSHVITNIPENDWTLQLQAGQCLDMPPLGAGELVIRVYGFDDAFRGAVAAASTQWLGRAAIDWLRLRGIELADAGIAPDEDLQAAKLFPVMAETDDVIGMIAWMLADDPDPASPWREKWLSAERLSADMIPNRIDLDRLYAQRQSRRVRSLFDLSSNHAQSIFYRLDLNHAAGEFAQAGARPESPDVNASPVIKMHHAMLESQISQVLGEFPEAANAEQQAFAALRDAVVDPVSAEPVMPSMKLLSDQIVWGRAPARIDLGGGWSDTPPYCLEKGGGVLNMAITLNGQPPVQVFGRRIAEPVLNIRSIDLGIAETLKTYDDVTRYDKIGGGFAIARAAFALAGFAPEFHDGSWPDLATQLNEMGGGLEVSMLAAIPKGSGLGTSSILAGTLLGVLSDMCGLGWDMEQVCRRTLALEQLLTSGGGWQDQIGGLYGGVKLITTAAGIDQTPVIRWAPSGFFGERDIQPRMLLYYTGVTRMARNILSEIVRGLFLNSSSVIRTIDKIGLNAHSLYEAVLRHDAAAFDRGIRQSWQLNCELDAGTQTPEIAAIIESVSGDISACKLAGAGGGGYMLMLARNAEAAFRIQDVLTKHPPNERARFVEMGISETGLQITRS